MPLGLDLKLFLWTCLDECKYQCMHNLTAAHVSLGVPVLQYYGKWPFYRFMGIQEPASVVFSVLNLIAHYLGYKWIKQLVSDKYQPLKNLNLLLALFQVNMWVWSTVFHCRDTPFTEKMDYFSAMASILMAVYASSVRLLSMMKSHKVRNAFKILLVTYFALHCLYLSLWRFDYTYNMAAGVTIGMVHNFSWLYWSFKYGYERPYSKYCLYGTMAVIFSISLELYDFPPLWGVFDAHSLWHLSTFPICFVWYKFMLEDAKYETRIKNV
ncbi:hypothetical protein MP638_003805 [Amoeboaphelidium occidentale]|nr:hypothetical protein MP638_003805 [Amoeboaphelidium occidentale]